MRLLLINMGYTSCLTTLLHGIFAAGGAFVSTQEKKKKKKDLGS